MEKALETYSSVQKITRHVTQLEAVQAYQSAAALTAPRGKFEAVKDVVLNAWLWPRISIVGPVLRVDEQLEAIRDKFRQEQPDDYCHDPRYSVKVSRQGQDRGAIKRDAYMKSIVCPVTGDVIEVLRTRTGVQRMFSDGLIGYDQMVAGLYFQRKFEAAGYVRYSSVDLSSEGIRGSAGIEGMLDRTAEDKKIVDKFLKAVGYPNTHMSKAVFWILGHGVSMNKFSSDKGLHEMEEGSDKRYWRGVLVCALEIMAVDFKKSKKKSNDHQSLSQRRFEPAEFKLVERKA